MLTRESTTEYAREMNNATMEVIDVEETPQPAANYASVSAAFLARPSIEKRIVIASRLCNLGQNECVAPIPHHPEESED